MGIVDFAIAKRITATALVGIMVACAWLGPLDSAADQQVESGLKRALIAFASVRTLNAVLSVAQGTEVAIQPAGIGVTLTPGQILNAVNNMLEQCAHLLLIASIVFGIEKILITLGAHWLISLILTAIAMSWCYLYLRQKPSPRWLNSMLAILLMVRFAIPVVIVGSELIFQEFMANDYTAIQKEVKTNTDQITSLSSETAAEQSILDKARTQFSTFKSRLSNLAQAAERSAEQIIKVIAIFAMQTVIIPLFTLWILWALVKGSFATPPEFARLIARRD